MTTNHPTCGARIAVFDGLDALKPETISHWLSLLPSADQQRVHAIGSPRRRREFIAARYLLMALLERSGVGGFSLQTRPSGQPYLSTSRGGFIACSISHSGQWIVVGLNGNGAIGVDVEQLRARRFDQLVESYWSTEDQALYAELAEAQRGRHFYRHWCRREALAKLSGRGLSLADLAVSETALAKAQGLVPSNLKWWCREPDAAEIAVVTSGRETISVYQVCLRSENDSVVLESID